MTAGVAGATDVAQSAANRSRARRSFAVERWGEHGRRDSRRTDILLQRVSLRSDPVPRSLFV